MEDIGKMLIGLGMAITFIGIAVALVGKIPILGRLPGGIVIRNENLSCSISLASSILLSIVLTLVLNFLIRLLNR